MSKPGFLDTSIGTNTLDVITYDSGYPPVNSASAVASNGRITSGVLITEYPAPIIPTSTPLTTQGGDYIESHRIGNVYDDPRLQIPVIDYGTPTMTPGTTLDEAITSAGLDDYAYKHHVREKYIPGWEDGIPPPYTNTGKLSAEMFSTGAKMATITLIILLSCAAASGVAMFLYLRHRRKKTNTTSTRGGWDW